MANTGHNMARRRVVTGTPDSADHYDPPAMPEVLYDVADGVARVTINRPERRNAMSYDVMAGLRDAMARARADDAVRVVVLTGAGGRGFCAGADLGGGRDGGTEGTRRNGRGSKAGAGEWHAGG